MRWSAAAHRFALGLMAPVLALGLSLPSAAWSQAFPNGPITLIVPYPPGNTTDIVTRLMARALAERIGQPVVISNRGGAGGAVGAKAVQLAPPNGYTIGLIASGHSIQPWLDKSMPFDIRKDFAQLNLNYTGEYIMVVPQSFPAKNLAEFIAYAKANPGKVNYGSTGLGTTTHLGGEMIKQAGKFEMTHVPYKGSTEVLQGVLTGDIQMYLDLYGTIEAQIKAGRLRPIVVLGQKRRANMPDVPALNETYPGMEVSAWTAYVAPLGTPKEITDKLSSEIAAVMRMPEIRQKFAELGAEAGGMSGNDLSQFILREYEKWGKVTVAAGMRPQ